MEKNKTLWSNRNIVIIQDDSEIIHFYYQDDPDKIEYHFSKHFWTDQYFSKE